ncbi:sulfur oxidation protein SoxY [Achromatium sp. WMS3]|nr:sulfur oxidation protein SoxY [Achromatium sp. WMS3]
MTDINRRNFLEKSLTTSTVGAAWAFGLLAPQAVLAAWPKEGFEAKDIPSVLKELHGIEVTVDDPSVKIKIPEIAENGAVVPVTIKSTMSGVTQIALFASVNPRPLAADFRLTDSVPPMVSTRIKLNKTGDVVAVVKVGDKLYSARKTVKVTIGGCGG